MVAFHRCRETFDTCFYHGSRFASSTSLLYVHIHHPSLSLSLYVIFYVRHISVLLLALNSADVSVLSVWSNICAPFLSVCTSSFSHGPPSSASVSAALFSPPQLNSSHCPQFYLHSILFLVNTFGISLAFSYRCNVSSPHLVTPHCDLQLNKIAESWCSGFTGEVEGLGQRETAEHKDYCVCATNCASTPSWQGLLHGFLAN